MVEIHLADFVGIGVQKDRHAAILEGGDGAVLVAEVRQAKNDAVVAPLAPASHAA